MFIASWYLSSLSALYLYSCVLVGYVDDVHGYSFLGSCSGDALDYFGNCLECGDSGDVSDQKGHGTHVAGIVAAIKDDGRGVAGVAPKVKIMVLKVGGWVRLHWGAGGWGGECMVCVGGWGVGRGVQNMGGSTLGKGGKESVG